MDDGAQPAVVQRLEPVRVARLCFVAETGLQVEQSDLLGPAKCSVQTGYRTLRLGSPAWCVGTQVSVQRTVVVYRRKSICGRAEATAATATAERASGGPHMSGRVDTIVGEWVCGWL